MTEDSAFPYDPVGGHRKRIYRQKTWKQRKIRKLLYQILKYKFNKRHNVDTGVTLRHIHVTIVAVEKNRC